MISNREIKTLMSLSTKKGRKESGKYLIEGFRITQLQRKSLKEDLEFQLEHQTHQG